jgi:hypothetical protein
MGAFFAWLGAFVESKLGSWAVSVLLALGVSFTSYKFGVEKFQSFIIQQVGGMPAVVAAVFGWLGGGIAMSMMLSAVAAKYATRGLQAVLTKKAAS